MTLRFNATPIKQKVSEMRDGTFFYNDKGELCQFLCRDTDCDYRYKNWDTGESPSDTYFQKPEADTLSFNIVQQIELKPKI